MRKAKREGMTKTTAERGFGGRIYKFVCAQNKEASLAHRCGRLSHGASGKS